MAHKNLYTNEIQVDSIGKAAISDESLIAQGYDPATHPASRDNVLARHYQEQREQRAREVSDRDMREGMRLTLEELSYLGEGVLRLPREPQEIVVNYKGNVLNNSEAAQMIGAREAGVAGNH